MRFFNVVMYSAYYIGVVLYYIIVDYSTTVFYRLVYIDNFHILGYACNRI
jgi:hypothetical protein